MTLVSLFLNVGDRVSIGMADFSSIMLLQIAGIVTRLGAIILGIYAVQVIFNLARYHIRVAHHLESSADAIELCDGDARKLAAVQKVLNPSAIDFGKQPASPSEKIFDVLKDVLKKIPTPPKS